MAFDTGKNNRPKFRFKVSKPRVYRVNDRWSVLCLGSELRFYSRWFMCSKCINIPTVMAMKEFFHV